MTKIYTRKGDDGKTSLIGGERILKCSLRIEVNGAIDETASALGLALSLAESKSVRRLLEKTAKDLFGISGYIARVKKRISPVAPKDIKRLERAIDELEKKLPPLRAFILPTGSSASAALHLARTIARRAERRLVALSQTEPMPQNIVAYFNRLSDLLFVCARYENISSGRKENFLK